MGDKCDNIKVVVKARPLIQREIHDGSQEHWRICDNDTLVQVDSKGSIIGQSYSFDKVYGVKTQTSDVYNDIAKPIVEAATRGINGTIFAYGQTSSGKTYTMMGTKDSCGIVQLAIYNLFDIIKSVPDRDFLLRVSYIEIYNEKLKDLLNIEKDNIKIRETLDGIKVDVTETVTTTPAEMLSIMKQGENNRKIGETNMNEQSSRSHTIFQITIESREHGAEAGTTGAGCVHISQLNLVDLAGSERSGQTGTTGLRFKEGTHINQSLSSLGMVIRQLSEDSKGHINYRDSKLTRMLQNSLGGNANTSIICAITPASVEETLSTLQFACRAKSIKNKPQVNAVKTEASMIQSLTKQIDKLMTEVKNTKNLEEDNKILKTRLDTLQRQILNSFTDRSSELLSANRRKTWCAPPRRMTMPPLHPIAEDPVPNLPSFCTPALKYNAAHYHEQIDFVPIQLAGAPNTAPAPSVQDEDRVTPTNKKVGFSDDVIELDSDDDDEDEIPKIEPCSPYHGCYVKSKTPPCVLREKATRAEKNLQEIMELTERERSYPPNVVEMIEKLEQNTLVIEKLQEELNIVNKKCHDKDSIVASLKLEIEKRDTNIEDITRALEEVRNQCKSYDSKLAEWEFSFNALKTKSKNREDELLSLLKDQETSSHNAIHLQQKRNESINFMDLSKDISLVNSDFEASMVNVRYVHESPSNVFENKNPTQHLKLLDVDCSSEQTEYYKLIKDKLQNIEEENILLKSTVRTLTSTIKSQSENLESKENDIKSYNDLIHELQLQLNEREIKIDNSVFEKMLSNEVMLLSNNQNIKNLICNFKHSIDIRNKTISELNEIADESNVYKTELNCNNQKMSMLENELARLQDTVNHSQTEISSLSKKNELILKEKLLIEKNLSEAVEKFNQLEIDFKETITKKDKEIETLLMSAGDLKSKVSDNELTLKKTIIINENLQKEIERMKDVLVEHKESQESIQKIDMVANRMTDLLCMILNNTYHRKNDNCENIDAIFTDLNNMMDAIQESLSKYSVHDCEYLIKGFASLSKKHETAIAALPNLKSFESSESGGLSLSAEFDKLSTYLDIQAGRNSELEYTLKNTKESEFKLNAELENLKKKYCEKEIILDNIIHEIETVIINSINKLKQENNDNYKENDVRIAEDGERLTKMMALFQEKLQQSLVQAENTKNDLNIKNGILLDISNGINSLAHTCNITDNTNDVNNIIKTITKYVVKIKTTIAEDLNSAKGEVCTIKKQLTCALNLIEELKQQNSEMNNNIVENSHIFDKLKVEVQSKTHDIEVLNNNAISLKGDLDRIQSENESLKANYEKLEKLLCNAQKNMPKSDSQKPLNLNQNKYSPMSLKNICVTQVSGLVNNMNEETDETSGSDVHSDVSESELCDCRNLLHILQEIQTENINLKNIIENLRVTNMDLYKRDQEGRQEIQSLSEELNDLYKKILNHRTSLSTLTATTFAENNLLKFKWKALYHQHSRYQYICEKDFPELKKNLFDLLTLLQSETNYAPKLNNSFKRYSLPVVLDNSNTVTSLRNESNITMDSECLMLDNNVTLDTTNDITVLDQTYSNVECESLVPHLTSRKESGVSDIVCNQATSNILPRIDIDNEILCDKRFDKDLQIDFTNFICTKCKHLDELKASLDQKIKQKEEIEQKYNKLILEREQLPLLVTKLETMEKDYNKKNKEIEQLQEENDALSTQLMENISEVDDLKKQLDNFNKVKIGTSLEEDSVKCLTNINNNDKANDNKYCTLQRKIEESKQDCIEIKKEVRSIRNHLECSSISLNQSINETVGNISSLRPDGYHYNEDDTKTINNTDEMFTGNKQECREYYLRISGNNAEDVDKNIECIDAMKLLYNYLVNEHASQIENLTNKLTQLQESKINLQSYIDDISLKYDMTCKELESKQQIISEFSEMVKYVKSNIDLVSDATSGNQSELVDKFKNNILKVFDKHLALLLTPLFETILDELSTKHEKEINDTVTKYKNLEIQVENLLSQLNIVNNSLEDMKGQLTDKQNDYNLLCAQKESIQKINSGITLDIVHKENQLKEFVTKVLQELIQHGVLEANDVNITDPAIEVLHTLIHQLLESYKQNINNSKLILQKKNHEMSLLQKEYSSLEDNNNKLIVQLSDIKNEVLKQHALNDHVSRDMSALKETILKYEATIENLNREIEMHKHQHHNLNENKIQELIEKVATLEQENTNLQNIHKFIKQEKDKLAIDLDKANIAIRTNVDDVARMEIEINHLKDNLKQKLITIDELKTNAQTLMKENDTLKHTRDQLDLNIRTHQKSTEIQCQIINRLQKEIGEQIVKMSQKDEQIEELKGILAALKTKPDDSLPNKKDRLSAQGRVWLGGSSDSDERRHRRRSAAFDSNRIMVDDHADEDSVEEVFASRDRPTDFFSETDRSTTTELTTKRQDTSLKSDQSGTDDSHRNSLLSTRRRRQSVHDQHRAALHQLDMNTENTSLEIDAGRASDKRQLELSELRAECATSARRLRDLSEQCCQLRQHNQDLENKLKKCKCSSNELSPDQDKIQKTALVEKNEKLLLALHEIQYKNTQLEATVADIRASLEQHKETKKELEELRIRYQELDEECETCAEYLKEREEQCFTLNADKVALETRLLEVSEKLSKCSCGDKKHVEKFHVAVNTDEDWSNLHSVVVDRMSYDAELDKNKKLTRALEEFRTRHRELKHALARAHDKLQQAAGDRDTTTATQLRALKEEVKELRECCSQREDECRRLCEAKYRLEQKLSSHTNCESTRKKRQSVHDANRGTSVTMVHAATATDHDGQLEEYMRHAQELDKAKTKEIEALRKELNSVSREKAVLERRAPPAVFVSTDSAIVQNQQIEDVMKENHKLRKMNDKLAKLCKKRGKLPDDHDRENEDPARH